MAGHGDLQKVTGEQTPVKSIPGWEKVKDPVWNSWRVLEWGFKPRWNRLLKRSPATSSRAGVSPQRAHLLHVPAGGRCRRVQQRGHIPCPASRPAPGQPRTPAWVPPDTNRYSQRPQGRFCLYFPETAWGWGGWKAWLGHRIHSCRAGLCGPPPGPACLLSVLMPRAGCQGAGSISDQLHTSRDPGCLTWSMWRLSLWNLC